MKNVMKRLAVLGLCVSMLAGCGKTANQTDGTVEKADMGLAGYTTEQDNEEVSAAGSITQLRAKYEDQEKYEYTDPMYNLEKDHVFTYDIGKDFYGTEEYDAFKVFSDSNLENFVSITVESDTDTNTMTISPNLVFSYEENEEIGSDGTWGSRSKFWLVQYIDTETGKELEKPLVTVFSIAQDLNTPTMKQSVGGNGYYKLSWSEVEGADYYEVYEYDGGMDYAELVATTENLECANDDFTNVQEYRERFKERYQDTEIDVDAQHSMNYCMDVERSYFVVAKTNDGKHSGMSNECRPGEMANQIPVSQSWDFQTDYEGSNALALPAYVDIEMMDGSIGKYVIEYHGATVALLDDGTIMVQPTIKNLPIDMWPVKLAGVDYDTFLAQADQLAQRGDELEGKTGAVDEDVDIPFVPDSQEKPDNVEEGEEGEDGDDDENGIGSEDGEEGGEDENGISSEDGDDEDENKKNNTVTTAGIELPENVAETVYANSAMGEWIALNLLAHNETISLEEFNEAADTEKLWDIFSEAYRQNPLCGTLSGEIRYDFDTNCLEVSYIQTEEELEFMQQESLKKAAEIADEIIKDGMSDYEKEAAINQYLCDNAEYNHGIMDYVDENGVIGIEAVETYPNSFNPYGVLVENLGVCESYSEAFSLIAREARLSSVIVTGTLQGGGHEWNRVLLDGKWYTLDVTNNDKEFGSNALFNISDEVAALLLKEDDESIMNEFLSQYTADDMKYEYYTVNGLYADDMETAKTMLADDLEKNGVAAVRVDIGFTDSDIENILQDVLARTGNGQVQYIVIGSVISLKTVE